MDITRAKNLKVGDTVHCPADRGEPGYSGRVEHISTTEQTHMDSKPFLWVTVRKSNSTAHVWPSNRLG